MAATAELVHVAAGRARIRVTGQKADVSEVLAAITAHCELEGTPLTVATNPRSGSALVSWDPGELDASRALEMVRAAHDALRDVMPTSAGQALDHSASAVARTLASGFGMANRKVYAATQGNVDLRMLVPLALGTLSVRQLVRTGPQVSRMPWYMLAYYAFDTFHKLHREPLGQPTQPST